MRKLFGPILTILMIAVLAGNVGCGATARAREHAELVCLEQDAVSLAAKLAASPGSPLGDELTLLPGEVSCALKALGAKPASAAPDAGVGV